ncbi:MAG: hypothetical protein WC840_00295 [Candidatus Peribacteraceae bacterium]
MQKLTPFSPSSREQRLLSEQMGIGFQEGPKGPQQPEGPKTPQEMITATDDANQMQFMRGVLSMRNTPQLHSPDQVTAAPQYANNPGQYLSDLTQPVLNAHDAKMQELWSKRGEIDRAGSFVEDVASMTAREKPKLVGERTAKWELSKIERTINVRRLRGNPVTRDKWYEWQHAAKDLQAFGQRRDRMRTGQLNRNMFMDVMRSGSADDRILNEAALRQETRYPTEEPLVLTPVDIPVEGPSQSMPRGPQFAPPERTAKGFILREQGEEAKGIPMGPEAQPMPALSPEMAQLFANLPPDVQRPMARLIDGLSPAEKQALEEAGGKLVEILKDPKCKDIFHALPISLTGELSTAEELNQVFQNEKAAMAKHNISPEAVKKVSEFLGSLSPEQRNVLNRVFRCATDVSQERQRKTEGYSLDLEKNPAKKAKILKYAERFTKAETEEDKLIAEGSLRMEGVDVDGSNFANGKVEMLPANGRFIGLIVGFIQMTMGILKKLGGKKTPTQSAGETSIQGWRSIAESKELVKKLDVDIGRLEELLKKPDITDKERLTYTESLRKLKESRTRLQSGIEDHETSLKRFDKDFGLEEHKAGSVVTQQAAGESADAKKGGAPGTLPAEGTEKPVEPLDPKQVGQQLDTMLLKIFGDAPGLSSCLYVDGTQDGKVTMTLDEGPLNRRVNQKQKSAEVMKKVLQEKKDLLPMLNERSGRRATEPMDRARLKAVLGELEAALRTEKEKRMGQ